MRISHFFFFELSLLLHNANRVEAEQDKEKEKGEFNFGTEIVFSGFFSRSKTVILALFGAFSS